MADSRYGTSRALTTNPDRSGALITVLPSALVTRSVTRPTTCGAVSTDGITSTRRCTGTGLKKCRPTTCAGRVVAWATWTMGIEEVLVARITSGRSATRSSSANRAALTAGSSVAASITSSRSARSSRAVVTRTRASAASRSSALSFPARTPRASEPSIRARPAAAAPSSTSRTTTSRPARAQTSTMPEPISPQPATPTRVISLMNFLSSDIAAVLAADLEECLGDLLQAAHPGGVHQDGEHVAAGSRRFFQLGQGAVRLLAVPFGEIPDAFQLGLLLLLGGAGEFSRDGHGPGGVAERV